MSVELGLSRWVVGCSHLVPVSAEEVADARRHREKLLNALAIEDRFDLLLENYAELERELLAISVDRSIFHSARLELEFDAFQLANRRLVNLLTAARMYLDQVPALFRNFVGDESAISAFRKRASEEYDRYLGYRVMEALRNHAQHRGLPIDTLHPGWRRLDETPLRVHYLGLLADTASLEEGGSFKTAVLVELKDTGVKKHDLKPMLREYMSGLRTVHLWIRDELSREVGVAEAFYESARVRYLEGSRDSTEVGLAYVGRLPDRTRELKVDMYPMVFQRRQWLQRKNADRNHLHNFWSTGQPMEQLGVKVPHNGG